MPLSAVIEDDPVQYQEKSVAAPTCRPSAPQLRYLTSGIGQPGGKLPLFDEFGQEFSAQTIRSCIEKGWAEPWFDNPVNPAWIVCRLTEAGRALVEPQAEHTAN